MPVPAATFAMGCSPADTDCEKDEGNPGGTQVAVPALRVDRHEVTVADYRACVPASARSRSATGGTSIATTIIPSGIRIPSNKRLEAAK